MSYIKGLNCCFPSNKVFQDQIVELSKDIFSQSIREFEKMLMVYKNSGVNTRYLVQNLDWYRKEHNWKERSNLFKVNSLILLKDCIKKSLDIANLKAKDIGGIVVVNSTGIITPTLDAELINIFDLNCNIKRLPIFGFGCAGGILGLNRSVEMQKNIKKPVLVCNVELCSLTFRPQIFSKPNVISSAIFGDGACSYIVDNVGDCMIADSFEYTWKNTLQFMGWGVENDGLAVIFDKIIPNFITENLPTIFRNFSTKNHSGYILHSGGMKVIKAYEKILNNHKTIEYSKKILRDYGNISSVSVLKVLEDMLKKNINGSFLMAALGPGFTIGIAKINV